MQLRDSELKCHDNHALNDKQLQLEVMKCQPRTIEEALSHAIKIEAYKQFLMLQPNSNAKEGEDGRSK